tara:strand:- start:555 stop:1016 length:462 start_codon:yes stop_codon:yes gene_type:complete
MARAKKSPTFEYGIEITKPHSKQMYDHNNHVANIMHINILNVATDIWNSIMDRERSDISQTDWSVYKDEKFNDFTYEKFQRAICYSSFGSGFTVLDVHNEIKREVEHAENWRMHELYSELFDAGMVPAIEHEMIGFTNNYNKNNATYATTPKE